MLLSDSESTQNKSKSEKKIKYRECYFFKTSRNVLPSSRPVDGVKKNSSLLGKPVDLAGVQVSDVTRSRLSNVTLTY